jgi:hypothetical protein
MSFSLTKALLTTAATAAIAIAAVPQPAVARELALAQGIITIRDPAPGLRNPKCSEFVVEARDALDNHLIAETQPTLDAEGACRYALSVPAQTAVWLHLMPLLVAGARSIAATNAAGGPVAPPASRAASGSVGIRFTIIAGTTYFFAPGEQKTVPLTY